jgi:2-amino-4-hydroxy-6-hydroxymethyldihydropteridine diphosphokinase
MIGAVYLALGSNLEGPWGTQEETLARALDELKSAGCSVMALSQTHKSQSLSPGQPPYFNLVASCRTSLSPLQLLHHAKVIERRSGRRPRQKWGARTLDIDIVMAGCCRLNWPLRRTGSLTLPHPEAHKRAFVLKPLCEISPTWCHPGLRLTALELLHRLPPRVQRAVQPVSAHR